MGDDDSLYAGSFLDSVTKFGPLDIADTSSYTSTGIASIGDTVMINYVWLREGFGYIKYWITYNGGSNWYWSFAQDTTQFVCYQTDITRRAENSFAYCFTGWSKSTLSYSGWFRYRDFGVGFSEYEEFADHDPDNDVKPAIVKIDSTILGIAYVSPPLDMAYFDRRDWVGIPENSEIRGNLRILPSPPIALSKAIISFEVESKTDIDIQVFDASGRLLKKLKRMGIPEGIHREEIDLPYSGVFIYKIISKGFIYSGRVVNIGF